VFSETLSLFEMTDGRAAPREPLVRVRMTVAYDGSTYHGFAAQPGLRTVAGTLGEALSKLLGHPVDLTGAGRTDKGVHAWGQVVSFDAEADRFDPLRLQRSLNGLCGPTLVVREVEPAARGFDARFSARSRRYRYTVVNRPVADPFRWSTSWHVAEPLDLAALRLAADPFIGEHDFSSFCRRPRPGRRAGCGEGAEPEQPSLVRRVIDCAWDEVEEGLLRFEVEATSFCHQMVRSMVGSMVDAGRGRRRAGDMGAIIRARSRAAAGDLAPARGLCLWEVRY
jgi:tRNA pseudouridine38-40 synthase